MRRRVLTVVLAIALAVAGTVGVFAYVRGADARAVAGQQPVAAVVADAPIPAGTSVTVAERDGLLRRVMLPAAAVPADAVPAVTGDLGGLVTGADLAAGQLLLRPLLVPAAQAAGGLAIPDGMIAVSVQLCLSQGVGGHVRPGARIVVFDTVISGADNVSSEPGCDGPHKQQVGTGVVTRVVLPDVQVLAVGQARVQTGSADAQEAGSRAATGPEGVLVTVAVDQAGAEQLITLAQTGLPYAALRGVSSTVTVSG